MYSCIHCLCLYVIEIDVSYLNKREVIVSGIPLWSMYEVPNIKTPYGEAHICLRV